MVIWRFPLAAPLWSEHHHDPNYLWPISAIAAFSLHGVLGWWMVQSRAANPTLEASVIQVVAMPVAPMPAASNTVLPTPTASQPAAEMAATPAQGSATVIPPEPVNPAVATTEPPSVAPTFRSSSPPALPQEVASDAPATVPASAAGATPSPVLTNEPGLQTWWTLRPLPQGRDLPDMLPQLPADQQAPYLNVDRDPCLAGQNWDALGSMTVALRLTVEMEGRISQIQSFQSSGNAAYDAAMICVLESLDPMLDPALTRGEPIASDVLLEITGSFRP